MTKQAGPGTRTRTAEGHRLGRWIIAGLLLVVIAAVAYWIRSGDEAVPAPAPPAPIPSELNGQWVRPDGGYVLAISECDPSGGMTAAYFNPRPINVSRAEWRLEDDRIIAFVELRDVNYPGSTYTLSYDPATDRLVGIYFQAAQQQQYEVEFRRQR